MKYKSSILLLLFFLFSFEKQNSCINSLINAEKIIEVRSFIKDKNYNQDLAMFIDFKIPSNKFRFFIYDFNSDKILEKGIVSHGSGSVIDDSDQLKFSNIADSYRSSLGKYEIGSSYKGIFGKSYRLKGLEESNYNALKRAIVLHSLECVRDHESEDLACVSLGCPMLSINFFKNVAKYIDASKKPIILYAYY